MKTIYLPIYLSIYGSTTLVNLGRFFSFLIYKQSVGFLGRGISPWQNLKTTFWLKKIESEEFSLIEKYDKRITTPAFWEVKVCSPINVLQTFGATYCLHLQGRR
jgi:hypothetical protein